MKNNQCPGCGSTQIAPFNIIPFKGTVKYLGALIILEESAPLLERLPVSPAKDYYVQFNIIVGMVIAIALLGSVVGHYNPEFSLPPILDIAALMGTSWSALGLAFVIMFFIGYLVFLNINDRQEYIRSVKKIPGKRCRSCRLTWRN